MTDSTSTSTDLTKSHLHDEEKADSPVHHRHVKLALDRIKDHRHQHRGTVGKDAQGDVDKEVEDFGHGKPFPPPLPAAEEYVVEFTDGNDPRHPHNWPTKQK